MHADAVTKNSIAYEHINPEVVGNERLFLMSEVAGRSAVLHLIKILTALLQRISRDKIDTGQAQGAGI